MKLSNLTSIFFTKKADRAIRGSRFETLKSVENSMGRFRGQKKRALVDVVKDFQAARYLEKTG